MKYFKIAVSLDIKEIGNFPQIQKFKKGYDDDRKESCSQIARYYFGKKPDVNIDFDCLELAKKAKLTDYMSASYLNDLTGLLASKNLHQFLTDLRTVDHVDYTVPIYQDGIIVSEGYKWIHFIQSYPDIINFVESDFFLDHSEANYKRLSLKSFVDYRTEQDRALYKINSKRLVLRSELVSKFDILRLGVVRNETFITEEVKNAMVERQFSGIVYEQADFLIVE